MGNAAPENTTSPLGTMPIQFLAIHWIQPPFSSKAAAFRCSKPIAPTRENPPQKQQQQLASQILYIFFKQPYKISAPTNTTTKHTSLLQKKDHPFLKSCTTTTTKLYKCSTTTSSLCLSRGINNHKKWSSSHN
jgi:hypothetical protein